MARIMPTGMGRPDMGQYGGESGRHAGLRRATNKLQKKIGQITVNAVLDGKPACIAINGYCVEIQSQGKAWGFDSTTLDPSYIRLQDQEQHEGVQLQRRGDKLFEFEAGEHNRQEAKKPSSKATINSVAKAQKVISDALSVEPDNLFLVGKSR